MTITKSELKSLIKECLREELGRKSPKRNIKESLNQLGIDELDYLDLTETDELKDILRKFRNNPVVKSFVSQDVYDKVRSGNGVIEMTANDQGDGHGEPKGYIFGKDNNVAYMHLSPNGYSFTPSISYREFVKLLTGHDELWYEIGYGDFNGAKTYIGDFDTVDDLIAKCDVEPKCWFEVDSWL